MSFLLDTNICSAHLRRPSGLSHRFLQHSGRLFISAIVLGELNVWAHRRPDPRKLLSAIDDGLLCDVTVIDFDRACAVEYGRQRGLLMAQGKSGNQIDLLIAATALVHDLTLLTHNTADFSDISGLRVVDWLES